MKLLKSFRPSDKSQKFYTFEGDCYRNDNLQLVEKMSQDITDKLTQSIN